MSDELDLAAEREEQERAAARTLRKPEGPAATGRCLYCDEALGERRWCDVECARQWEKEHHHGKFR